MGCKVLHILAVECSKFFRNKFKNVTRDGVGLKKIFKKWYKRCFLEILKIFIYFDMLFMNF